jgi:hypothetical protein
MTKENFISSSVSLLKKWKQVFSLHFCTHSKTCKMYIRGTHFTYTKCWTKRIETQSFVFVCDKDKKDAILRQSCYRLRIVPISDTIDIAMKVILPTAQLILRSRELKYSMLFMEAGTWSHGLTTGPSPHTHQHGHMDPVLVSILWSK